MINPFLDKSSVCVYLLVLLFTCPHSILLRQLVRYTKDQKIFLGQLSNSYINTRCLVDIPPNSAPQLLDCDMVSDIGQTKWIFSQVTPCSCDSQSETSVWNLNWKLKKEVLFVNLVTYAGQFSPKLGHEALHGGDAHFNQPVLQGGDARLHGPEVELDYSPCTILSCRHLLPGLFAKRPVNSMDRAHFKC